MLTISDEVICGFGRTGEWFGAQTLNYRPTSLSMAKQLTAGFLPLSAVAISQDMADVIEANSGRIGTFGHGYTYGGHPVACAVGIRALEIYERLDICARVRALAPHLAAHLDRLAGHPLVGEARHLGLVGALEVAPGQIARRLRRAGQGRRAAGEELLARGVITRAVGDSRVLPADDHHRGRDRRDVRPGGGGARRHRGLGPGGRPPALSAPAPPTRRPGRTTTRCAASG